MKQNELPRCPECGNMPEYALKPNHIGWVWGGLKCPYDHYRVNLNGPAGSRAQAEKSWRHSGLNWSKRLPPLALA